MLLLIIKAIGAIFLKQSTGDYYVSTNGVKLVLTNKTGSAKNIKKDKPNNRVDVKTRMRINKQLIVEDDNGRLILGNARQHSSNDGFFFFQLTPYGNTIIKRRNECVLFKKNLTTNVSSDFDPLENAELYLGKCESPDVLRIVETNSKINSSILNDNDELRKIAGRLIE